MRGRNKDFIVAGNKMVFRRNYGIDIDSHEIDSSLTFSENFNLLYSKFVSLSYHK